MSEKINLPPLDEITPPTVPPVKSFPKIPIFVTVPVLVLIFFATFTYAFNLGKQSNPPQVVTPTPTPIIDRPLPTPTQVQATPTGIVLNTTQINPGSITWLQFPTSASLTAYQQPNSQGYIGQSNIIYKDIKYLQVASFSDGSVLINAMVPSEGMGIWYHVDHFIKTPQGQVYYLVPEKNQSGYNIYNSPTTFLLPQVKFTNFKVDGLDFPDVIDTDKGSFRSTTFFMDNTISFTELKNPELVVDTPYGRIYSVYSEASKNLNLTINGGIYDRKFWLRLKDDTVRGYELSIKFITDDRIPKITWDDGTVNTVSYQAGFPGGCGMNSGKILKGNTPLSSQFTKVGVNSQGESIYAISDTTNPIFKKIYDGLDISKRPDMDTFLKRHNHFLWQEPLGEWWIFTSNEDIIEAECAKPVVYLYPTSQTKVNLRVGAIVTKSEPTYPVGGWNVIASPSGKISYNGRTYPNLFWEGTGEGTYPNKQEYGFSVAQEDLVATVKNHLRLQGLNEQETADFLEFWEPKFPKSPYVRLTWLNTKELDELAPLYVSPKPDTSIRVFLDFAPLDKPVSLIPQTLTSVPRQGFTLVEWGGLLVK